VNRLPEVIRYAFIEVILPARPALHGIEARSRPSNDTAHRLRAECPPRRILWSASCHRRPAPSEARGTPRPPAACAC
jgi:hypothetical protein